MIRCITFDWGDTLAVNWGMPYIATERRLLRRLASDLHECGGRADEAWAEACLRELQAEWNLTADSARNPEQREMDFPGLMRGWVSATGCDPADPRVSAAVDRAWDRMTDTVIPYAEMVPALSRLHALGYRLGILSHVPWPGDPCRRWHQRHGSAPFLHFYSLSCEIGRIKPHPAHYQDAIRQAGCAPHEILHVGDHPMRDVEGGRRFGLRTCLRRTERIYPEEALDACRPDAEILHLAEIEAVAASL
ncbi:MAG: HAD family hydrolase [Planctomycetes bacterium]|nr:HAD family hydrolase [Planctomycetota bacterium]